MDVSIQNKNGRKRGMITQQIRRTGKKIKKMKLTSYNKSI